MPVPYVLLNGIRSTHGLIYGIPPTTKALLPHSLPGRTVAISSLLISFAYHCFKLLCCDLGQDTIGAGSGVLQNYQARIVLLLRNL